MLYARDGCVLPSPVCGWPRWPVVPLFARVACSATDSKWKPWYKLEVQDLHKRYGSHEVLKGVSLAAKAGDVIGIMAPVARAKYLPALHQPAGTATQQQILLNNEELKLSPTGRWPQAGDPRQLQRMRSRLSMVFQHFNLWSHMSALENVMEAPVRARYEQKDALEKAEHYLNKVGVAHRKDAYPAHMSGGEQQRGDCPRLGHGA